MISRCLLQNRSKTMPCSCPDISLDVQCAPLRSGAKQSKPDLAGIMIKPNSFCVRSFSVQCDGKIHMKPE